MMGELCSMVFYMNPFLNICFLFGLFQLSMWVIYSNINNAKYFNVTRNRGVSKMRLGTWFVPCLLLCNDYMGGGFLLLFSYIGISCIVCPNPVGPGCQLFSVVHKNSNHHLLGATIVSYSAPLLWPWVKICSVTLLSWPYWTLSRHLWTRVQVALWYLERQALYFMYLLVCSLIPVVLTNTLMKSFLC